MTGSGADATGNSGDCGSDCGAGMTGANGSGPTATGGGVGGDATGTMGASGAGETGGTDVRFKKLPGLGRSPFEGH